MRMRDFWESLILAFLLAVFGRVFFLSVYKIPSSSMAPTLWPGDYILGSKFAYGVKVPFINTKLNAHAPERGDLVIFEYPDKKDVTFVKRVMGLPGDHIILKGNQLFINEVPFALQEVKESDIIGHWSDYPGKEYLKLYSETGMGFSHFVMHPTEEFSDPKAIHELGPFVVPPGEVFVLGDNRESSDDSRYWGTIPIQLIEGKVFFVWLSFDFNNKWAGNRLPSIRTERFLKFVQ